MVIIGVDPDSYRSGIACYKNGTLLNLQNMGLIEIWKYLEQRKADSFGSLEYSLELHIEDVNHISSNAFAVRSKDPLPVKLKKAEHVGRCKQTQIEIERIAESLEIIVVKHTVSSKWKDKNGKREFENVTGWTGRSNEDTRSAAYFGKLGVIAHGKK